MSTTNSKIPMSKDPKEDPVDFDYIRVKRFPVQVDPNRKSDSRSLKQGDEKEVIDDRISDGDDKKFNLLVSQRPSLVGKPEMAPALMMGLKDLMRRHKGMRRGGISAGPHGRAWQGLHDIYRYDTVLRSSGNGGTGVLYAPVVPLTPNSTSVTEAASLQILYDLMRVVGFTIYVKVSGTSAILNMGAWAFAFDPANSGAYTSVQGILVAAQHHGPIAYNQAPSTGSVSTMVESRTGYQILEVGTLKGMVPTAGTLTPGTSEDVGSQWFATSDQNAVAGYLKLAADPVAGNAISYDTFVVFHCEYASRS